MISVYYCTGVPLALTCKSASYQLTVHTVNCIRSTQNISMIAMKMLAVAISQWCDRHQCGCTMPNCGRYYYSIMWHMVVLEKRYISHLCIHLYYNKWGITDIFPPWGVQGNIWSIYPSSGGKYNSYSTVARIYGDVNHALVLRLWPRTRVGLLP